GAQKHPSGSVAYYGCFHRGNWLAAHLCTNRHLGTAAVGAVPLGAGFGFRWRMGRRSIASHRKRPTRQTRLVWHVPTARCTTWLYFGRWFFLVAGAFFNRRTVFCLGLAHSLSC